MLAPVNVLSLEPRPLSRPWSSLFRGFDEDYVNDEENALSASFSKSHNLEDMAQFPSNFSVIKID